MTQSDAPLNTLVLGVGNILMADDGLGVHAIRALEQRMHARPSRDPSIQCMDGGTQGVALLAYAEGCQRLVILDCLEAGGAPGTIYRFPWQELECLGRECGPTLHQTGVADLVALLELVGPAPQTTVVGMEPDRVDVGTELSPIVQNNLPKLIATVERMVGCCE